ncbi:unnamed protein product [Kluyveromyces dobzhanskii CBS 2104]|uniref:WGS project CCBQ000000000 data, contig 00272 n=1 Tax=Kluyveromyces dobzhanskii CBS 2104 TaxID=1427455 RepID=A0A0A8LAU8_9SACH|nr:unnamed protein product [Kluyveromyces dobzhanskii CBS 2104]
MSLFNADDVQGFFQGVSLNSSARLVCNKSNVIYLWQDNILRVQSDHDTQYQSFDVKLPFVPEQMVLSPSGNLIAFNCKTEFYVVEWSQPTGLRKLFTTGTGIKKLLWHPLATYELSVVILHDDSTIKIYEIDDTDPESITVFNQKSKSFGLSDHVDSVCDIAFDPTGLTLYLLSSFEYCDVYAIYPCLPKNFSLSINNELYSSETQNDTFANYMLHKSLSLFNNFDKHLESVSDASTDDTESGCLTLKHDLLKQIQFFRNYQKNDGVDIYTSKAIRNAMPQGPFMIKNFPNSLDAKEASALDVVPLNESVGLLNVHFRDGTNVILFPSSEPIMNWSLRANNTFNTLSAITVYNAQGSCQSSSLSEPKLVFSTPNLTTIIEMPWLQPLSQCLRLHDFSILDEVKFENEITTVPGSYLGIIPTLSGDFLYNHNSVKVLESSESSITKTVSDLPEKVEYQYKPALPTSGNEIDLLLKSYRTRAEGFIPGIPDSLASIPLKNETNENQLEVVSKLYKETMERVKLGQMVSFRMFNKTNEQVAELHRQLRKTNEANTLRNKLKEHLANLEERYMVYEQKSKSLETRLDKIKKTFSTIEENEKLRTSRISDAEVAWFKAIKIQVLKFNNFVHTTSKLRQELEFLHAQLQSTPKECQSFSESEFDSLQQMLTNDKRVIDSCVKELTSSISELNV